MQLAHSGILRSAPLPPKGRCVMMQHRKSLETHIYVVVIAQEGSFIRAARRLGIPPPSLTRKIALLEKDLGVHLFDRSTRRIELTKAGRLFISEATVAVQYAERAWDLARYQARIEQGPFRIGYSPYVHSAFSSQLQQLTVPGSDPPGIALETASTPQLIERVLRGQLHAALGVQPIVDRDLSVEPIGQEGWAVCLPRNHILAQKAAISVTDLHGAIVFWFPSSMHPRFFRRSVKYIHSLGVSPVFKEVHANIQAIEFVAHGFGLALLPRSAIRLARSGIVFKLLSDRYLKLETALFMREDLRAGPLQDFINDLSFRLRRLGNEIQ